MISPMKRIKVQGKFAPSPMQRKALKLQQREMKRAKITLQLQRYGVRPHIATIAAKKFVAAGQDPDSMPEGQLRQALKQAAASLARRTSRKRVPEGPTEGDSIRKTQGLDRTDQSVDATKRQQVRGHAGSTGVEEGKADPFDAACTVDQKLYAAQLARQEKVARVRRLKYHKELQQQQKQRTRVLYQNGDIDRRIAEDAVAFERQVRDAEDRAVREKQKQREAFRVGMLLHMRETQKQKRERREREMRESIRLRQAADDAVLRSKRAAQARKVAYRVELAEDAKLNHTLQQQKEIEAEHARRRDDELTRQQMAALDAREEERLRKVAMAKKKIQDKLDAMQASFEVGETPEQLAARRAAKEKAEMEAKSDFQAHAKAEHQRLDAMETRAVLLQQMKEHDEQRKVALRQGRKELDDFFKQDREFEQEVRGTIKHQHQDRLRYGEELRRDIQARPQVPVGRHAPQVQPPASLRWVIEPSLRAKQGALQAVVADLQSEPPARLSSHAMQELRAAGLDSQILGSGAGLQDTLLAKTVSVDNPLGDRDGLRGFADSPAKSRMAALDKRGERFKQGSR